jgi:hypothetical protein
MTNRRLKVFLCHASEDKPSVRLLYRKLLDEGAEPWLDEENLLPGENWRDSIGLAMRQSDAVVLCLSRKTESKVGFVQREIYDALDFAKEHPDGGARFLIPAQIEECDIPPRLGHLQATKLYEAGGYNKLLNALRIKATALGVSFEPAESAADIYSTSSSVKTALSLNQQAVIPYFREVFLETFWEHDEPFFRKRRDVFTVSLIGESGVGKTALAYVLTRARFNFLDTSHTSSPAYKYRLQLSDHVFVVDHHTWSDGSAWEDVRLYMAEHTDLALFLVSPWPSGAADAERAFAQVRQAASPSIVIANKIDLLEDKPLDSFADEVRQAFGQTPLPISAAKGIGIPALRKFILKASMQIAF